MEFPPERNNGKILPQSFDYEILPLNQVRVGNLLFDAGSFQLNPSVQGASIVFNLRWPAGLLKQGVLQLRQRSGKVFAEKKFMAANLVLIPVPRVSGTVTENLKSEIASDRFTFRGEKILKELQNLTRLCMLQSFGASSSEICSPLFRVLNGRIQQQKASKADPLIEVDSQKVGSPGQIFLQVGEKPLEFKVGLSSGAQILIRVRAQPIQIGILESIPDRKMFRVRGNSIELSDDRIITESGPNYWIAEVPFERAQFFFLGESGIPLKQEISYFGQDVSNWPRIRLSQESPGQSFLRDFSLIIQAEEPVSIQTLSAKNRITPKASRFLWQIEDLEKGERRRIPLQIKKADRTYVGVYEIERGRRWITSWSAGTQLTGTLTSWISRGMGLQARASTRNSWLDWMFRKGDSFPWDNPSWMWGLSFGRVQSSIESGSTAGLFLNFPIGDAKGFSAEIQTRLTSLSQELSIPLLYRSSPLWMWELELGGGLYIRELSPLLSFGFRRSF